MNKRSNQQTKKLIRNIKSKEMNWDNKQMEKCLVNVDHKWRQISCLTLRKYKEICWCSCALSWLWYNTSKAGIVFNTFLLERSHTFRTLSLLELEKKLVTVSNNSIWAPIVQLDCKIIHSCINYHIFNHVSRSITSFLFIMKASNLVKWPISLWSFMWWCHIIDYLKFKTRPVPCATSERPILPPIFVFWQGSGESRPSGKLRPR